MFSRMLNEVSNVQCFCNQWEDIESSQPLAAHCAVCDVRWTYQTKAKVLAIQFECHKITLFEECLEVSSLLEGIIVTNLMEALQKSGKDTNACTNTNPSFQLLRLHKYLPESL